VHGIGAVGDAGGLAGRAVRLADRLVADHHELGLVERPQRIVSLRIAITPVGREDGLSVPRPQDLRRQ
jgi:hypothetical protein